MLYALPHPRLCIMQPTQIRLGGKDIIARESRRPLKNDDGYIKDDQLVISKGLSDHAKLDTFLHEALHHQFYFLDEDVVRAAATELADALDATGLA